MKALTLFLVILLGLVVFSPVVLAVNGVGKTGDSIGKTGDGVTLPDPLGGKDFITILKQIVNFLILAAIPIAALMIIYGAYQIMFAGGDTEKVTTGKRTILYTVTAFVIILLAWSIIAIIQNVLGVKVVG
ncbi:MAG: hypothetical protein HY378_01605 [Candidatus Brennerbacteria bacterium]|nr:hypothetical protein [Candidatus Brennerbacteria bacterium]